MVSFLLRKESVYLNSLLKYEKYPKTIKHMPVTINKAKINLGDDEKDNVHLSSQEFYQNHPWTWLVILIL